MEKDKNILRIGIILIVAIIVGLNACEPEIIDRDGELETTVEENIGSITFDFPIPERNVPVDKIYRINLSIAVDAFSLYSGYFLKSANVSDLLRTYSFSLEDGEYYYQAGITCSAAGDTCLWDGFPGGQWGTKWTSGKIQIIKGEMIYKNLTFNN